MSHIGKVEIYNSEGISQLIFAPKKMNIIVGRNGVGKSAVLRVIEKQYSSPNTDITHILYENAKYYFSSPERILIAEKILKKCGLCDLEELNTDYIIFTHDTTQKIPYIKTGSGFKSLVGLVLKLIDNPISNRIILLNNPDIRMGFDYLITLASIIIKFSIEQNIQFFITTHNRDLLDIFFDEYLSEKEETYLKNELTILRIERIKQYTHATYLNYDEAKEERKLYLDLRGL